MSTTFAQPQQVNGFGVSNGVVTPGTWSFSPANNTQSGQNPQNANATQTAQNTTNTPSAPFNGFAPFGVSPSFGPGLGTTPWLPGGTFGVSNPFAGSFGPVATPWASAYGYSPVGVSGVPFSSAPSPVNGLFGGGSIQSGWNPFVAPFSNIANGWNGSIPFGNWQSGIPTSFNANPFGPFNSATSPWNVSPTVPFAGGPWTNTFNNSFGTPFNSPFSSPFNGAFSNPFNGSFNGGFGGFNNWGIPVNASGWTAGVSSVPFGVASPFINGSTPPWNGFNPLANWNNAFCAAPFSNLPFPPAMGGYPGVGGPQNGFFFTQPTNATYPFVGPTDNGQARSVNLYAQAA